MRQNKIFLLLIPFFLVSLTFGANVFAFPVQSGDYIEFDAGIRGNGGGEFEVYRSDAAGNKGIFLFKTFCLETDEFLNFEDTFRVDDVSDRAVGGGSGGPSPDPLDDKTAWMFLQYYSGAYQVLDGDDAANLQDAIWKAEQENIPLPISGGAQDLLDAAEAAVAAGFTNNGRVAVINLTGLDKGAAQDVLVAVPEPTTILLSGIGLLGMGCFLRRKFKKV
jgi:hypothetical protein